jgi:hypothetical protein
MTTEPKETIVMSDNHAKAIATVEHLPIERHDTMHPLVASMLAKINDPAGLAQLMDLQRQWEKDEALKAFTRAKIALKKDLPTVLSRDKTVDFTAVGARVYYKHTSLASAMDAVTEPLIAHGFSLAWEPSTSPDGSKVTVKCILTHCGGHSQETSISAPADTKGSKSGAQGVASTITLLQRYTALSLLGIATADMAEPTGEPADTSSTVDPDRNLRAAGRLRKEGHDVAQVEQYLGKPVKDWTGADLKSIPEWIKRQAAT